MSSKNIMNRTYLDPDQAWKEILQNARAAMEQQQVYTSTKRGQRYKVISVVEDHILISRLDATATETLRRADVARAVKTLNDAAGPVPRQSLNYTVAKEVAMVQFHPQLRWDATQDHIEVIGEQAEQDGLSAAASTPQFWAFVSNPTIYRIEDVISEQECDTWRVGTHQVHAGDLALIWKAKGREDKRGIVALAEVLSEPLLRQSPNPGYYRNPADGTTPTMRAEIRYVRLPNLPLWHDETPDSLLGGLSCCKATGGTVFKVTAGDWNDIVDLAGGWPGEHSSVTANGDKPATGRNPSWSRDELILALDLYLRENPAHISDSHPDVIELSNLLRSLPIHAFRPDPVRFRNANGVYMKLCNFLRFDPNYSGSGLKAGAKGEEAIWNEFIDDRHRLLQLAGAIRSGAAELNSQTEPLPSDSEEEDVEVLEGRVLLKLHKVRERNPALVQKRKTQALKQKGCLECEVCGFDFQVIYGALGFGFIECHHTRPISQMQAGELTKLEHLALVCSNCHRMLHRGGETLTIEQLRSTRKQMGAGLYNRTAF